MKIDTITTLIRIPLLMFLCWKIYEENGIYTAFGFFIVFIIIELITKTLRQFKKLNLEIVKSIYSGNKNG